MGLGSSQSAIPPVDTNDVVQVVNPVGHTKLTDTISQALCTGQLSDIRLSARGGTLCAHRLVLMSQCENIKDPLLNYRCNNIPLEFDWYIVKYVLEFVYQNKVTIPKAFIPCVASAAKFLGVRNLYVICKKEELKNKSVTYDNCLELWIVGQDIEDERVAATAKAEALRSFCRIKRTSAYKELPFYILKAYITDSALQVSRPEDRLAGALAWARFDEEKRVKMLDSIVDSLPVSDMNHWYLDQLLEDPLVKNYPTITEKIVRSLEIIAKKKEKSTPFESQDENEVKETSTKSSQASPIEFSETEKTMTTISTYTPKVQIPEQVVTNISQQCTDDPKRKAKVWNESIETSTTTIPVQATPDTAVQKERCLVYTGSRTGRIWDRNVKMIYLERNMQVKSLGGMPAIFRGTTSCCIKGNDLFVSGLGDDFNEIWKYNLCERKASKCGGLCISRSQHASCVGSDGQLYILGGWDRINKSATWSVERFDPQQGVCEEIGKLRSWNCYNGGLKAAVLDQDNLVVCGAKGQRNCNTIQVWNTKSRKTVESVLLPDKSQSIVYGVVVIEGYVVVISETYTAVCVVQDLLAANTSSALMCDNYTCPNEDCGVTLSSDGDKLILIGGVPKQGIAEHLVYEAPVTEVIHNNGPGWKPKQTVWKVGNCRFIGSCDVTYIAK